MVVQHAFSSKSCVEPQKIDLFEEFAIPLFIGFDFVQKILHGHFERFCHAFEAIEVSKFTTKQLEIERDRVFVELLFWAVAAITGRLFFHGFTI